MTLSALAAESQTYQMPFSAPARGKVGVLGGMGPMATVDFIQKVVQLTPAQFDQQHIPLLIHSVPQIPDRTACLMSGGESPLAAMQAGVNWLVSGGATCIVIPCNTAHFWQPELIVPDTVEVLHIAEIVTEKLKKSGIKKVGLLATDGTWKGEVYQSPLSRAGINVLPISDESQRSVMGGIYAVKSGNTELGGKLLEEQTQLLIEQGAELIIMACTEIPLAMQFIQSKYLSQTVDATAELARACVEWHAGLA